VKEKTLDTLDTLREERRTFSQRDWITKDCDSRRSWIGGEGLPSRDQVREKTEQRAVTSGFQLIGATTTGSCHTSFVQSLSACTWVSVETGAYIHGFS
jgi:hypothetical protein